MLPRTMYPLGTEQVRRSHPVGTEEALSLSEIVAGDEHLKGRKLVWRYLHAIGRYYYAITTLLPWSYYGVWGK